jgi:lantibiotic modifying enzyme
VRVENGVLGMPSTAAGRPALEGRDRERALAWAQRLADPLRWADAGRLGQSLATGAAGLGLMYAYMATCVDPLYYEEAAERYLALANDGGVTDLAAAGVGLYEGLAGVVWVEHVTARLRGEPPRGRDDLDELLLGVLARPWPGPWGLADGMVGLGVYALERRASVPGMLELVTDQLDAVRTTGPERVLDVSTLYRARGSGQPALGMAHGLSGLVSLSALAGTGTRELLSEATGALLAYQQPTDEAVEQPGAQWCDGYTGIAAALSLATPLLSHPLVLPAMMQTVRAIPTEPSRAGVAKLGLFDGVAGIAHTLQAIAGSGAGEGTGEAAGAWARSLIDRLDAGERCSGPGLLHGTAGVVLTLLGLATDVAPLWNRAMLLA